jgi:hypothetical protein
MAALIGVDGGGTYGVKCSSKSYHSPDLDPSHAVAGRSEVWQELVREDVLIRVDHQISLPVIVDSWHKHPKIFRRVPSY